jgi:hypothetical protein
MTDAQPKSPNPCGDLEAVNAFARDAHDHLSNSILLADQKAGYLFATVTAVLAYLHSTGASQRWLTGLKEGRWGLAETLILLAMAGLVVGAVGSLLVVIPRIRGSAKGLVAAWAVASFETPQDYVELVLQSDPATLARAKLEHVWNLSQINRRKYQIITVALRCSFAGLLAAILYLVSF